MTIKEINEYIKEQFSDIDNIGKNLIEKLNNDYRKGVKKIAKKINKKKTKRQKMIKKWHQQNKDIDDLQNKGYKFIAGVDEAGRGPLAGPVVSSAVILDINDPILGLTDSKKLSEQRREELFDIILKKAKSVGIGIVSNTIIDRVNIHQATFLAMKRAVNDLKKEPEYILVDGSYI